MNFFKYFLINRNFLSVLIIYKFGVLSLKMITISIVTKN